jgi:hypothetical protein
LRGAGGPIQRSRQKCSRIAIAKVDLGNLPERVEPGENAFPNGGVRIVEVTKSCLAAQPYEQ